MGVVGAGNALLIHSPPHSFTRSVVHSVVHSLPHSLTPTLPHTNTPAPSSPGSDDMAKWPLRQSPYENKKRIVTILLSSTSRLRASCSLHIGPQAPSLVLCKIKLRLCTEFQNSGCHSWQHGKEAGQLSLTCSSLLGLASDGQATILGRSGCQRELPTWSLQ